jgi:hypothetical protein
VNPQPGVESFPAEIIHGEHDLKQFTVPVAACIISRTDVFGHQGCGLDCSSWRRRGRMGDAVLGAVGRGKKNGGALDGICAARIRLGYRFVLVDLWRRDRIQRTRCDRALLNADHRSCGEWPGSNLAYPFKSLDRNRRFQI